MPQPGFLEMLAEISNGGLIMEGSEQLEQLIAAVRNTRKAGKLVLTIGITPSKILNNGDVATVLASYSFGLKEPKLGSGDTTFFTTKGNGLMRDDPSQFEMFQQEKEAK